MRIGCLSIWPSSRTAICHPMQASQIDFSFKVCRSEWYREQNDSPAGTTNIKKIFVYSIVWHLSGGNIASSISSPCRSLSFDYRTMQWGKHWVWSSSPTFCSPSHRLTLSMNFGNSFFFFFLKLTCFIWQMKMLDKVSSMVFQVIKFLLLISLILMVHISSIYFCFWMYS